MLALVLAADRFLQARRAGDARAYQIAAGVIALFSLSCVARDSVANPHWAVAVGGIYSVVSFVLSRRWRYAMLEQVGIFLTTLTTFAALHWSIPGEWPRWAACSPEKH